MANSCLIEAQIISPWQKETAQTRVFMRFFLPETLLTSIKERRIISTQNWHKTYRLSGTTFVETAVFVLTCDHTLPPLYWEAVKEGMIHLLVGSYVKKPDSGVFSDWSRNNAFETLHSYWLSYFNLISGQNVGLARRKQNGGDRARF